MLSGTLGASLLGNILERKEELAMEIKDKIMKKKKIFNAASSCTNFEMQKSYQNEPRFNGVYSRDNLHKIKDGAYIINIDEYSDIGTNIFRIQKYDSIMCGYFCFGFIDYMLAEKTLQIFFHQINLKEMMI